MLPPVHPILPTFQVYMDMAMKTISTKILLCTILPLIANNN